MGFDASTLSNIAIGGQVAGAVTSAFGAYGSASVQRANLGAQAAVARANAQIAELGAQSELQAGQKRIAALTQQAGQLKGRQRAAMAANGVALTEGSAYDIQASTDAMTETDKINLEIDSMRAAFGQRMQAGNYRSQAAMAEANRGAISPFAAFGGTLLGGATRVAETWYRLKPPSSGGLVGPGRDPLGAFITLNNW